jgi:hypothetical protein
VSRSSGCRWRGKIALEGDSLGGGYRAWVPFNVAVVEKRWRWDVNVDDAEYVAIESYVQAVVVGRKEYRISAGIPIVAVDFLMYKPFDV